MVLVALVGLVGLLVEACSFVGLKHARLVGFVGLVLLEGCSVRPLKQMEKKKW